MKNSDGERQRDDTWFPLSCESKSNSSSKRAELVDIRASPSSSLLSIAVEYDSLPTNVCTEEQLILLPIECLSNTDSTTGNNRPLRHVHEDGAVTTYSLRPIKYSVLFILIVEVLEGFSFYSINFTLTSYLTGQYDSMWNAQMDSITASSYVSILVAVAYTSPFIGAVLGDNVFGEYNTILFGWLILYWPGLVLVALSTIPHLFHMKQFNHTMLHLGVLIMIPVGSGIVKSVINIFGAKQFHPLLQSSLLETYYVNLYMCVNFGALAGGITVPLVASQTNVTVAYLLPVTMLCIGICVFVAGTPRYVQTNTTQSENSSTTSDSSLTAFMRSIFVPLSHCSSALSTNTIHPKKAKITAYKLFRVFLLIVPFCIALSQMSTTFIIQGTVMGKACGGYVDAAFMYNNDTLSVLVFGYIIGSYIYPALAERKIKIPTTYKFATGSAFACLAIIWALLVDYMIHTTYNTTGGTVSVLWQAPSYILIGIGEIFAISAAYEVAFVAAPPEIKVLSSALNIFCVGGLPNVICIGLIQLCQPWFANGSDGTTNVSSLEDYASAHVYKYFVVLLVLCSSGVIVNILPRVKKYVDSIEQVSVELIKSPKIPKTPILFHQDSSNFGGGTDDAVACSRIKSDIECAQLSKQQQQKHEYFMKIAAIPILSQVNLTHAGIALQNFTFADRTESTMTRKDADTKPKLKKKTILLKLYQTAADEDNDVAISIANQYYSLNGRLV
jgi:proton-dependent oligopeptide transporter, POT family